MELQQVRKSLRVIDIEKEVALAKAGTPTGFDMETALKEQGFWECDDWHCKDCPYLRNLKCLERNGLLRGDPKYDTSYRAVLHSDPGQGMKFEPRPIAIESNGMVEVYVKPPFKAGKLTKKQKKAAKNRGKK